MAHAGRLKVALAQSYFLWCRYPAMIMNFVRKFGILLLCVALIPRYCFFENQSRIAKHRFCAGHTNRKIGNPAVCSA